MIKRVIKKLVGNLKPAKFKTYFGLYVRFTMPQSMDAYCAYYAYAYTVQVGI